MKASDHVNEGLCEARKAIAKLVDLYFDNVPVDELEREQIVETIHEGLSDEFDRLYRIEATVDRVRAEVDRITALYANVTADDGRADSFATGARWTTRMLRENALAEPVRPVECPPGVHSLFDPCPGDCGAPTPS